MDMVTPVRPLGSAPDGALHVAQSHRHGASARTGAASRRPSALELGVAGRLGLALGGIGLVWSAIALGLA